MRAPFRFDRHPKIRPGHVDDSSLGSTPIRNTAFVSFFSSNRMRDRRETRVLDNRLRWSQRFKFAALVALTALCTWVVIESAHALSTF